NLLLPCQPPTRLLQVTGDADVYQGGGCPGGVTRGRFQILQPAGGSGNGRESRRLRSEEHTPELQSLTNLVCRLLLEKKTRLPASVHRSHDGRASNPAANGRRPDVTDPPRPPQRRLFAPRPARHHPPPHIATDDPPHI